MLKITAEQAKVIVDNSETFQTVAALLGAGGQGGYPGQSGTEALQTAANFTLIYNESVSSAALPRTIFFANIDIDLATLFAKAVKLSGPMSFYIAEKLKSLATALGIADEFTASLD
jgi:hypothetical protein